ncbi:MAG: hypothetical protein ABIQ27_06170 [Flavobacterium sp.]|uniref:hypothetical protein n=1 Tax=Flavobacterium sp. TaxID=239 RepID=UPI003267B472
MKKIKLIFVFILSISSFNLIGQSAASTDSNSKIHFVYHKKSNLFINEKGIYADTLLLKTGFKELTYQLTKHPTDSTKTVGFIDLKRISKEDQKRIIGIFSHSNFKYDCYYNIKKNQTAMYVTRIENDETHDLLKSLFKDTFSNEYYNRIYIDYNKSDKFYTNSRFSTLYKFNQKYIVIDWFDENKIGGEYKHLEGEVTYKDLVLADSTLEKHVTPFFTFANCDYGIQKLVTFFDTTELISVNLE